MTARLRWGCPPVHCRWAVSYDPTCQHPHVSFPEVFPCPCSISSQRPTGPSNPVHVAQQHPSLDPHSVPPPPGSTKIAPQAASTTFTQHYGSTAEAGPTPGHDKSPYPYNPLPLHPTSSHFPPGLLLLASVGPTRPFHS